LPSLAIRRPSELVKQIGSSKLARQIGAGKSAGPPIAATDFCEKTNVHFWQGWILPPIAPTLGAVRRFRLFLMLWSLFGEQGSGFFSAFAAVDGT
jgi:hypothetical protein